MALMDEAAWRGKIDAGGWVDGAGAAQLAAAAQPAWAATPHTGRSALLRRGAGLWLASAPAIEWWGIRVTIGGDIAPYPF